MTTIFDFADEPTHIGPGRPGCTDAAVFAELLAASIPRTFERARRVGGPSRTRSSATSLRELFAHPLPTLAEALLDVRATVGDGSAARIESILLREGIPAAELLLPHVQQALRQLARTAARLGDPRVAQDNL